MSLESTHDDGQDIMPKFESLKPTDSFASRILPPNTYSNYHKAISCYRNIASYVQDILEKPSFSKYAPTAKLALSCVSDSNADGFECLSVMLQNTLQHRGSIGANPQIMTETLILFAGDEISAFMNKAMKIQETIELTKM